MKNTALLFLLASCLPAQAQQSVPPQAAQAAQPRQLMGHKDSVRALLWTRDGQTLYSTGDDGQVIAWDPATGKQRMSFSAEHQSLSSLTAMDDGQLAASNVFSITVWNSSGTVLRTIQSETAMFGITWLPRTKLLAAPQQDGMMQLWSLAGDRPVIAGSMRLHKSDIRLFQSEAHGKIYATTDSDGVLSVSDDNGHPFFSVIAGEAGLSCVAVSSEKNTVAAVTLDGTLKIWQMPEPNPAHTINLGAAASSCRFTPAGDFLAIATQSGEIRIYSISDGTQLPVLAGKRGEIFALAFSPDAATLATGSENRAVTLWPVSYPPNAPKQGMPPEEKKIQQVQQPAPPPATHFSLKIPSLAFKIAGGALGLALLLLFLQMTAKSVLSIIADRKQERRDRARQTIPEMAPEQTAPDTNTQPQQFVAQPAQFIQQPSPAAEQPLIAPQEQPQPAQEIPAQQPSPEIVTPPDQDRPAVDDHGFPELRLRK